MFIPIRFCQDCHSQIKGIVHAQPYYNVSYQMLNEGYMEKAFGTIVDRYCMECTRKKEFVCSHPQDPEPPCLNILLSRR